MKNAIMQSVELLETQRYDDIKGIIDKAMTAGMERDIGHEYITGFEERMTKQARDTQPTAWDSVNDLMDGGLGKGELGVIVAPAGIPAPDTAIPVTSPVVEETVMLLLLVDVVELARVVLEIAAAAALGTPVTPAGSEVVGLFSPKPKSEPMALLASYQTDKLRPSLVVKVKPPLPESPATTP